jgi:DtxR family Mn-dependent transcriptional regulator
MEDYLEAIAILNREKGFARVRDIGRMLKVKTPSVTGALATLERDDLVHHERYGYVELTPKGKRIALDITQRHAILHRFLTLVLQIDPETAEGDSCRLEHSMSPETMEKLTKFIDFVESCPEQEEPEWLRNFYYFMETGERRGCGKFGKSGLIEKQDEHTPGAGTELAGG